MSKERMTAREMLKKYKELFQEYPFEEMYYKDTDAILFCMEAYAKQAIAKRKKKAIGVDAFCDRLDNIFEMGNPTKAQIIDAYNKSVAERMPTEEDAIRYAADYATELDASEEPHTDIEKMDIFLHGTRWFRSRMTEKEEPYIDKSISIDEYMNMNPKLDPHEQSEEDASDDDIEEEEWHEIHDDINEERRSGGIE
jgi:hypothetical protein